MKRARALWHRQHVSVRIEADDKEEISNEVRIVVMRRIRACPSNPPYQTTTTTTTNTSDRSRKKRDDHDERIALYLKLKKIPKKDRQVNKLQFNALRIYYPYHTTSGVAEKKIKDSRDAYADPSTGVAEKQNATVKANYNARRERLSI